ncbi:zinc finger CCHC domain-containing protein 10-like [Anthonomus grandis grandis]|uniref:zinc finger CCHC domain-containing protein 10-like n=1 Tax=Anthonomus grandis grandis TaxID=2921223 RepID=UPI0021664D57|nr:zinc finger CCHC domain-containing protein 10-like [Anthonomus grandis grandis]
MINVTSRTQKIMDSVRSKHESDKQCMDQNGTKVICDAGDIKIYDTLLPKPNNITDSISCTDAQEDILPLAEIQNVSTTKSILASNENHTINNIADECPEDEKETLSHVKEQNVVITEFDSDYDNRASSSDNYNPENESDSTSSSSSCSTCSTSSSSSSSSKDTSEETKKLPLKRKKKNIGTWKKISENKKDLEERHT